MKFPKEDLQELVSGSFDGYEVMVDKIMGRDRWSVHYHMIFKYQDKFYSTSYSRGATEYQEEYPYEDEDYLIECDEVEQYEKTIIAYRSPTKQT